MSEGEVQARRRGSLGYVLILFAGLVLFLTRGIESFGLGSNADPGARLFPITLSIALAIAGGIVIWKDWRGGVESGDPSDSERRTRSATIASDESGTMSERLRRSEQLRAGYLLAMFMVYIVSLPWLGFGLSTLTLATLMMRILSASWVMALTVSGVLVLIVYLLFGLLFHVPLPSGILGLPF